MVVPPWRTSALSSSASYLEHGVVDKGDSKTMEGISSPANLDVYRVEVLNLSISARPGTYMLSENIEVPYAIEFTTEHA